MTDFNDDDFNDDDSTILGIDEYLAKNNGKKLPDINDIHELPSLTKELLKIKDNTKKPENRDQDDMTSENIKIKSSELPGTVNDSGADEPMVTEVVSESIPDIEKIEPEDLVDDEDSMIDMDFIEDPSNESQSDPASNDKELFRETIKDLLEKINKLNIELADEKNKKLRLAADMENLKKRNSKNLDVAVSRVKIDVVTEFLPVVDHLEMALEHSKDSTNISAFKEGVEMVLKQFNNSLNKFGVTKIEALGEIFDPNIHEAMAQEDSDLYEAGIVISQWQKGYLMGDRLVRPARVVVSKGPGPAPSEEK